MAERGGDAPAYQIAYDVRARVVRVAVRGFWSVATVDDYTAALRDAIDQARHDDGPIAVMIDAATMQAQAADVGARFVGTWTALLRQPGDRAAIVVHSALAAIQFKRMYQTERCRVFDRAATAETWLAGGADRAAG